MSRSAETALLPAGLQDVLPPEAAHEAAMVERLMGIFAGHGYERVKPPLVEFEDSLLSGAGAAMAKRSFRLMDPISQRMMAVRADMTLAGRAHRRHPALAPGRGRLRLSYAGQVLRVKGSKLRPERQVGQVGVELIGADSAAADVEVILLAAEALAALGRRASLDRSQSAARWCRRSPQAAAWTQASTAALRAALDRRDAAAVGRLAGREAPLFRALLRRPGSARPALRRARQRSICRAAAAASATGWPRSSSCCSRARPSWCSPSIRSSIAASNITPASASPCWRAACAASSAAAGAIVSGKGEAATGFTLYLDTLLRAVPAPKPRAASVPAGRRRRARIAAAWRAKGWVTVAGLEPGGRSSGRGAPARLQPSVCRAGRAVALTKKRAEE